LKKDVTEVLALLRLLSGLAQMLESGTEEEKTAIEFETRLGAMIDKHARHFSTRIDATEGEFLELPFISRRPRCQGHRKAKPATRLSPNTDGRQGSQGFEVQFTPLSLRLDTHLDQH
jgi:hypothetical protein